MSGPTVQLTLFLSRGRARVNRVLSSLRAARQRVSKALAIYSEIQLNARAAPSRERKGCHSP